MKTKPDHDITDALADLFARDITNELAAGRQENAAAIARHLGIELPESADGSVISVLTE
jgi:hypothetical protein